MREKALQHRSIIGITILAASWSISSCGTNPANQQVKTPSTPEKTLSSPANAALAQAKSYERLGKIKRALAGYVKINKKHPYTNAASEACFAQANLLDRQGKLVEAFAIHQNLIKHHPNSRYYAPAIKRQEEIAHSVANGIIQNNFLGLKTNITPKKTISMLSDVRDNAPSAPSASLAQYTIGQVLQKNNDYADATKAYRKLALDYSQSKEAPEALFQTGEILLAKAAKGNQNKANISSARNIFSSLIDNYPNHPRAKDARTRIAALKDQGIQRNYDTAEFYRKKGKNTSAIFYYNQVIQNTKGGTLHNLAKQKIAELSL